MNIDPSKNKKLSSLFKSSTSTEILNKNKIFLKITQQKQDQKDTFDPVIKKYNESMKPITLELEEKKSIETDSNDTSVNDCRAVILNITKFNSTSKVLPSRDVIKQCILSFMYFMWRWGGILSINLGSIVRNLITGGLYVAPYGMSAATSMVEGIVEAATVSYRTGAIVGKCCIVASRYATPVMINLLSMFVNLILLMCSSTSTGISELMTMIQTFGKISPTQAVPPEPQVPRFPNREPPVTLEMDYGKCPEPYPYFCGSNTQFGRPNSRGSKSPCVSKKSHCNVSWVFNC
jgi:hypothetical protein